jgi:hypothetical protein
MQLLGHLFHLSVHVKFVKFLSLFSFLSLNLIVMSLMKHC